MKLGHQRLLELADHLEKVPPEKFDMHFWSCGTVACAVGHCCNIPSFREAGLQIVNELAATVEYQGYYGFWGVSKFFEIEPNEATFLFSPRSYVDRPITIPTVVKRIRDFVQEQETHVDPTPAP